MAKKTFFLNAVGKESKKKADTYARVITDSKKGTFNAYIDALPENASALLKGIEDLLGEWLEVRANMPQDPVEGSQVTLAADANSFSVEAPTSSLSKEHLKAIDASWTDFMKQFEAPNKSQNSNNGQQDGGNQSDGNNQSNSQQNSGDQSDGNNQSNSQQDGSDQDDGEDDPEFDICSATIEQTLEHNRKRNPLLRQLGC